MTIGHEQALPTPWDSFKQAVQEEVSPGAWQTWIAPLVAEPSETSLTLKAPSEFHCSWVKDRYLAALRRATVIAYGPDVELELIASPEDVSPKPLQLDPSRPWSPPLGTNLARRALRSTAKRA